MMLLIDLGNSACKWAVCTGGRLTDHGHSDLTGKSAVLAIKDALSQPPVDVWIGSVLSTEKTQAFCESVQQQWQLQPRVVEAETQGHGICSAYSRPSDLGNDRWLAMIGARSLYQGLSLIVDVGTAATLDVLDQRGQHLGGQIIPGYRTMIASLNQSTDGIQVITTEQRGSFFAAGTQNAATLGSLTAIGAWVDRAAQQLTDTHSETVHCLLTGGDAGILEPYIKTKCERVPDLVLQGLGVVAGGDA